MAADHSLRPARALSAIALVPFVLVLPFATPVSADPQPSGPAVDPSIGRTEVTLQLPPGGDKPYVGEMIILRMRSFIRANIERDEIIQPPLLNFSWQQLGRDKPISAMVDGFEVAGFERDLAIFPDTSGRLIIEPFQRRVVIVTDNNQRVQADFASKPLYVDIQNYSAINPPGEWWLPAKSLTISDAWGQVPDEIKPGTLARRTVTIEAAGLTADRLPPPPTMSAPGTIAFRGPVERTTVVTEDGPVARGTYVWDLRPTTNAPAQLPAIRIAWYDTQNRRLRSAAIAETWVAYVGTLVHPSHEKPRAVGPFSPGPLVAGFASFAWAGGLAAFLVLSRRRLGRRAVWRARALSALRRAARFEDDTAFSRALVALARSDPSRWRDVARTPAVASRLAALDTARYGRIPAERPALKPLAADIRRLWLEAEPNGEGATGGMAPLDGAYSGASTIGS